MTRNTFTSLLTLCALATLIGCSAEPEAVAPAEFDEIRTGTLEAIDALQKQVDDDAVKAKTVQSVLTGLNALIGRMKSKNIGTDEQFATLEDLRNRLANTGTARRLPPPDWRPDMTDKRAEPTVDAAPVAALLPAIREVVQAISD